MTYNLKRCAECREILPAKAKFFPRNKSRADGLATRCHECNRKVISDWRKSNREHVNMNQQIRYYSKKLDGLRRTEVKEGGKIKKVWTRRAA